MGVLSFAGLISRTWIGIWISLNGVVLGILAFLYRIFVAVANANLFTKDVYDKFVDRVYILISVITLFAFAFNLIKLIVDPDAKKEAGNAKQLVKEIMITMSLIVLFPKIFQYMAVFQKHVLQEDIIAKIVFNVGSDDDCNKYEKNGGYKILDYDDWVDKFQDDFWLIDTETLFYKCNNYDSLDGNEQGARVIIPSVFQAFFHPKDFGINECEEYIDACHEYDNPEKCNYGGVIDTLEEKRVCIAYYFNMKASKFDGNINGFTSSEEWAKEVVGDSGKGKLKIPFEFNYLFCIIAGGLAAYMFVCYTLEIGVRVAKLGFLQIISPIAVMFRLIPKQKGNFDKWLKELTNAYVDVFIRLFIIFFAIFSITLVPDVIKGLASVQGDFGVRLLAQIVVILGILKFAMDAPKLLQTVFNMTGGSFSLKSPAKQIRENKIVSGLTNPIRSGIYGATTAEKGNRFKDFAKGAFSSVKNKGDYDKAVKSLDTFRTEKANGSTFGGRMADRMRNAIGMETRAESEDRQINRRSEMMFHNSERSKQNSELNKSITAIRDIASKKIVADDSKCQLEVSKDGKTYGSKEFNYATHLRNIQSMEREVDSITVTRRESAVIDGKTVERDVIDEGATRAAREEKLKEIQEYRSALEDAKKARVTQSVTDALKTEEGGKTDILGESDVATIKDETRKINRTIREGGVGRVYDESGRFDERKDWSREIKSGEDLFGKKDLVGGKEVKFEGLQDALGKQYRDISQKSNTSHSKDYGRYQADKRMIKGQGQAEKK